jgi:hypothetical protein
MNLLLIRFVNFMPWTCKRSITATDDRKMGLVSYSPWFDPFSATFASRKRTDGVFMYISTAASQLGPAGADRTNGSPQIDLFVYMCGNADAFVCLRPRWGLLASGREGDQPAAFSPRQVSVEVHSIWCFRANCQRSQARLFGGLQKSSCPTLQPIVKYL